MKSYLKRNIFIVIGISLIFVAFEVFTSLEYTALFGVSLLIISGGFFIGHYLIRRIVFIIGLFLMGLVIFMTKSVWLLIIAIILMLLLFNTKEGNEFIQSEESLLHPYRQPNKYQGIQIIRPQSEQRKLLTRRSIMNTINSDQMNFPANDINLVYISGDNIIDLGNTVIPSGECVVLIRKFFGRTRIIVPKNVGLLLNISALSGQVVFEQETYALTGENFQWISPGYDEASRRIKIITSVFFGNVEVIVL